MPKNTNKQTQPHEIKVHLRKQEVKKCLRINITYLNITKNVNSTDIFNFYFLFISKLFTMAQEYEVLDTYE